MAQITSSTGLISGIDTGSIITQLIAIEQQPVSLLQTQLDSNKTQQSVYNVLGSSIGGLQTIGKSLELPSTFSASTATSSDNSVLTATTGVGAAVGSYQFQVAQLVTSQQSVSNGFSSASSPLKAGNITISLGGGDLQSETKLNDLNGGAGVDRGSFRITDRAGNSAVVDISSAISLDDVVKKINTALNIDVHATVSRDHLVLTDTTGATTGNLKVTDLNDGTAAAGLGITGSVAANTLTGTGINSISAATALTSLNDGRGVGTAKGAADFQVNLADGSSVSVALGSAGTIGDVITAINNAGGSKLKASIDATTNALTLTDTSGGSGAATVGALNGSKAAADLGLTGSSSGGVLHGKTILAGLDSTLISSLRGGSGLDLGTISIADRSGATATIDLSGSTSVSELLDRINTATGVHVNASLNTSGNGIQLTDASGGTGNLVIGDVGSTTASELGINGTFDATQATVAGANLHPQYLSENTLLTDLNGGKGVGKGSFTIAAANGSSATVDLSSGTYNTLGDVISAINAKSIGVTASINTNGNGLLLTDTTGGGGKLAVTNVSGTAATDLNIVGTATGTSIDGAYEKSIAVTSSDTLATVQQKITSLGFGVVANLINDGSGANSEHLSLTATASGRAGRLVIDGGSTGLDLQTIVNAQDAAVFYGGSGSGSQPLLITNSSNLISNVIPGVTLNLQGVSSSPVTLNVTRDPSSIEDQLQKYTDGFNALVDEITTLTAYDSTTNTGGLLLGDATTQTIQTQLYSALQAFVKNAGRYQSLADVGITVGDGAKLSFDKSKFESAYATDADAVKKLFSQADTGLGALIDKSLTKLVDPVDGVITRENSTLDNANTSIQDRIDELDVLIADKKSRLEEQFANMESVLAGLQSQQSALSSLTGVKATTSSSSGSSSSSSSSTTSASAA